MTELDLLILATALDRYTEEHHFQVPWTDLADMVVVAGHDEAKARRRAEILADRGIFNRAVLRGTDSTVLLTGEGVREAARHAAGFATLRGRLPQLIQAADEKNGYVVGSTLLEQLPGAHPWAVLTALEVIEAHGGVRLANTQRPENTIVYLRPGLDDLL